MSRIVTHALWVLFLGDIVQMFTEEIWLGHSRAGQETMVAGGVFHAIVGCRICSRLCVCDGR